MNRDQKAALVASLKNSLTSNAFVAIVHYRGMSDKQLYDMRVELKTKSCEMKIAKNTLVRVAVKGTDLEVLTPYLKGPTAILCSQDIVALSKAISDVSKKVAILKIVTGHFNKALLTEANIKDLAKLGSFEEVRSSFLGVLTSAQSNFVRILNAPEQGLASSF